MSAASNSGPIVIAGGSGFLGVSLATYLAKRGRPIVILSRHRPSVEGPWKHVSWDARSVGEWRRELNGAAGLVNLVGRSVDCVKTRDRQDEILRSRVEATRALGVALRTIEDPPPVWVQMSTAHIYGDPPQAICSEESAFGFGLAPFVGRAWEDEFRASVLASQRAVILRPGFVVGRNRGTGGGALARLRTLARFGLAGRVGSGNQGMSWIHETDMNRLFERALDNPEMEGAYVASSPNPVSQQVFMGVLRRAVGMPLGLPAPEWMVRFGARWLMSTDPDLVLYGRYVVSTRLEEEGFEFQFPHLEEALGDLLGRASGSGTSRLSRSVVAHRDKSVRIPAQ